MGLQMERAIARVLVTHPSAALACTLFSADMHVDTEPAARMLSGGISFKLQICFKFAESSPHPGSSGVLSPTAAIVQLAICAAVHAYEYSV